VILKCFFSIRNNCLQKEIIYPLIETNEGLICWPLIKPSKLIAWVCLSAKKSFDRDFSPVSTSFFKSLLIQLNKSTKRWRNCYLHVLPSDIKSETLSKRNSQIPFLVYFFQHITLKAQGSQLEETRAQRQWFETMINRWKSVWREFFHSLLSLYQGLNRE